MVVGMRNEHKIFVGKPEGKKPVGIPTPTCDSIIIK
jgi:hypothetical protein